MSHDVDWDCPAIGQSPSSLSPDRRGPGLHSETQRDRLEIDRFSTDARGARRRRSPTQYAVCSWHSGGAETSSRSRTRGAAANWQPKTPPRQRSRSPSRTARSRRSGLADRSHTVAARRHMSGRWNFARHSPEDIMSSVIGIAMAVPPRRAVRQNQRQTKYQPAPRGALSYPRCSREGFGGYSWV